MPPEIQTTRLTSTHPLNCPACNKPLLLVHPESTEVPDRETWLQDGDAIPVLFGQLSEQQKTPEGFDYLLMVGTCAYCGEDYYAILANFLNASGEEALEYVHFNEPLEQERNFLCRLSEPVERVPENWILQEYATPVGPMHAYTFGPWRLEDPGSVKGPWGVMACRYQSREDSPWEYGRWLLHTLWDALRALRTPESAQ